jgi:16S rRNA (adenine1518-N6/adenine1519-N6)-dimethyltransferase
MSEVGPGSSVLEFGAGLGSLTLALAETGARVVAVELDRYILPVLRSVAEPVGAEVVEGDAMTLDVAALLRERGDGPWSLVANLPYNLATPLVFRTLVEVPAVQRLLVMVQREVGERMAAKVGDAAYGSVSVRVAYFATSSVAGRVPASVFIPRPRVESVLVRMERRPMPAVDSALVSYERLAAVVKAGFGQRRKMLRGSLAGVVEPEAFERAGIRPDARAEELDVEEWGRLAQ